MCELDGDDAFFAAPSRGDGVGVEAFVAGLPGLVERLKASEPGVVATLAGAGNTDAVELVLDIGLPLSPDALSLAVWRERSATVRLLLSRGARSRRRFCRWPSARLLNPPSGLRTTRRRSLDTLRSASA